MLNLLLPYFSSHNSAAATIFLTLSQLYRHTFLVSLVSGDHTLDCVPPDLLFVVGLGVSETQNCVFIYSLDRDLSEIAVKNGRIRHSSQSI